jgi:ribosomal protein L10
MTRGLYGNEEETDFIFEHNNLRNEKLKELRSRILDFIRRYNLVKNN